ncbi:MAG: fimbria/pilus outer membrane usher protein [Betaproteobacteria bacterium]|nr:fimbria/pilus outer membrane usher protein [Betaproteobacteria bacterium]
MRPGAIGWRLFVFLALGHWLSATAQTASAPVAPATDRLLPMEVTVNGDKSGVWLFVERGGALYAPREAFEEWRVRLDPEAKGITFRGEDYRPLASVPGYRSKIDFANQSLDLYFSPEAFAATRLGLKMSTTLTVNPAVPSVFLNYDVNYQRSDYRGAPTLQDFGVIGEIGFSSDIGVLTSSFVGRNLAGDSASGEPGRFLRLETTLTIHRPEKSQTLTVGDTSTRLGLLGSSVYFGGIRFGTNFGLTPGFIRHPLPTLSGVSTAPSTVNLYVNDVLRQTSNIPTGPFAIDNFPALTGSGEARLVVRDLLGRETVITQSFFSSNQLLAAGLDDWSIEAGKLRENLGGASNQYGAAFARGFWRHGYSDTLTLEGIGQITSRQKTLELGLQFPVAGQWLGSAAISTSRLSNLGTVSQWLLGLERQWLRSSIFLQAKGASKTFDDPGHNLDIASVKQQLTGNWSYASDSMGSFGIGWASTTPFSEGRIGPARVDTMTANYSVRISKQATLNLTASRSKGAYDGSSLGFTLVLPMEKGPIYVASANKTGKETDFFLAATDNATAENPVGWRVLAGERQKQRHAEAGVHYLGRYGSLTGDVSSSTDQTTVRVTGTGGLVLSEGQLFATTKSTDSFALVEVAGYGNVGVGLGGNMLTRTNDDGYALIPRLIPYQANSARLAANDLPVSAELDSIEMQVVPAWRTVVKARFPVRSGRGALLKIQLDDGEPAPAGATVNIEGDSQEFYVARRGEAFVTGLQPSNRVVLKWKDRQCSFDVVLPPESSEEIPRLGPLSCKGIPR